MMLMSNQMTKFRSPVFPNFGLPKEPLADESFDEVTLSPRAEVEMKKETRRLEEESQFTFKPNLLKRSNQIATLTAMQNKCSANDDDNVSVVSGGMSSAKHPVRGSSLPMRSTASVKKMKITSKQAAECANRLYSHQRSQPDQSTSSPVQKDEAVKNTKKVTKMEADQAVRSMYERAEAAKARMEQVKQQQDSHISSLCPFKPELLKHIVRKDSKGKDGQWQETLELTERMNRFAVEKERNLQEAKRAKEREELRECTFKPAMAASGSKVEPRSVDASTLSCRQCFTPEEYSFQPTIHRSKTATSPSSMILTRSGSEPDVHSRLYQKSVSVKEQEEARLKRLQEEADKVCTFQPQLFDSRSSPSSCIVTSPDGSNEPVYNRLFYKSLTVKEQEEARLKRLQEEADKVCTFQPQLFDSRGRGHSPDLEVSKVPVYDRLSHVTMTVKEQEEARQKIREEQEVKDCTFRPQVSSHASNITCEQPFHERLNAHSGLAYISAEDKKRQELKAAYELRGATFSPEISPVSAIMAKHYQQKHSSPGSTCTNSRSSSPKAGNARSKGGSGSGSGSSSGSRFSPGSTPASSNSCSKIGSADKVGTDAFSRLSQPRMPIERSPSSTSTPIHSLEKKSSFRNPTSLVFSPSSYASPSHSSLRRCSTSGSIGSTSSLRRCSTSGSIGSASSRFSVGSGSKPASFAKGKSGGNGNSGSKMPVRQQLESVGVYETNACATGGAGAVTQMANKTKVRSKTVASTVDELDAAGVIDCCCSLEETSIDDRDIDAETDARIAASRLAEEQEQALLEARLSEEADVAEKARLDEEARSSAEAAKVLEVDGQLEEKAYLSEEQTEQEEAEAEEACFAEELAVTQQELEDAAVEEAVQEETEDEDVGVPDLEVTEAPQILSFEDEETY